MVWFTKISSILSNMDDYVIVISSLQFQVDVVTGQMAVQAGGRKRSQVKQMVHIRRMIGFRSSIIIDYKCNSLFHSLTLPLFLSVLLYICTK